MLEKQNFRKRWENYQASKTSVFWACAGCIVATAIIGFAWGGWVTGGTAARMVTQGAIAARADLAADICVRRFESGPDAVVNFASLKTSSPWSRSGPWGRSGGPGRWTAWAVPP